MAKVSKPKQENLFFTFNLLEIMQGDRSENQSPTAGSFAPLGP